MKERTELVDNRDGNTMAQVLCALLSGNEDGQSPIHAVIVRIATAFFSPAGFGRVADGLSRAREVRLLLGADFATAGRLVEPKQLDETRQRFEKRRMRASLRQMDDTLRRERDQLPFSRTSRTALVKLIEALRSGNLEVRRYEDTFMHAKAYLITPAEEIPDGEEGVIVGSSNLTAAGLSENLELNMGRYDSAVVERACRWFDDLWEDAEPYEIDLIFEDALTPRSPWEIFIRVLWKLYGGEVEEDAQSDENLPLTSFQKHGVARALRLIRECGGAVVADEVGLGKTFIAGEILQMYHEKRQRTLLICPAALRDSTWKKFQTRFMMHLECLSFEQLAQDRKLRDARRPNANQRNLQRPLEEYQLIVVDEAHNYRSPDTPTRAAALRRLLFGQRRDLLLLTATPVNNSLWDLYHLLRFFLRQDAHFANRGILSIRRRFEMAMRQDPSSLSPDVLYPIIDATTVKRTRQFVKKHYAGDSIIGAEGKSLPIVFPKPIAISVHYNLEERLPGFFDSLEKALDPDDDNAIRFARYQPDAYRLGVRDQESDWQAYTPVGLLRTGLLKRFESSALAFRRTVEMMVRGHGQFLDALDRGWVVTTAFLDELSADDESVFETVLAETEHRSPVSLYDESSLRTAVERDRDILQGLADEAAKITPDSDPKLRALSRSLGEIVRQAEHEATDGIDEVQKRKVVVFSSFSDTVEWIRGFIELDLASNPELAGYRNRIVSVSGSGTKFKITKEQAAIGFAPRSMEALPGSDDDLYDLMISTDVLAEGVNLQQCRHIINFDMPWNPMRMVQRHGRIDRIGSPHSRVFMRTIFPVDRLDQLLKLEQRILAKLAMAAASVGVATPIKGGAHGSQVFSETREEIEKLLREDPSLYERGGTAGAAQTGEEYRQTLRKALETDRDRFVNMPWKVGSGMIRGSRRGVFFCAVVGRDSKFERTYLRFVPANNAWQQQGDGHIERELGTCLRLIECSEDTSTWHPDSLQETVYDFWDTARSDVLDEWMEQTDPAKLQPDIRPLNLRVAEFIRANPPPDVSEDRLRLALETLESPWPRREEVMLRQWFNESELEGAALSRSLVDEIISTGLEPVVPPPPLPPIGVDDIELLCWMGIEPEPTEASQSG